MVDDGDHEDRSRGPGAARPRDGAQRVRRLRRRRGDRARDRLRSPRATGCGRSRSISASASSRSGSRCRCSLVRETPAHAAARGEAARASRSTVLGAREVFWRTSLLDREPVEREPGGARQQPQRRHGVGPVPAVLRRGEPRRSIASAGSPRSTRRRGASRSSSPARCPIASAASGSSPAACGCRPSGSRWSRSAERLRVLRRRRRAARPRHRDGVPDAARRDRGRRASDVARLGGRRLSAVARSRLCDRRGARRHHGRRCSASPRRCGSSQCSRSLSGVVVATRMTETRDKKGRSS